MPAKQAINDKLQGSYVTAYLRCGGVVNNQIEKGLLLSLWVKKIKWWFLKSVKIWHNYGHESMAQLSAHPVGRYRYWDQCFLWRYEPVRRTGKSDDWLTIFLLA